MLDDPGVRLVSDLGQDQGVIAAEVDFLASPISLAEEEFLNVVIVHFQTSWLLAREGAMLTLDVLVADVRWFFSLPLPRAVWQQTREFRDPLFVEFVENAVHGEGCTA